MNKTLFQTLVFWLMRTFHYSVVAIIGYILLDILWNGLPVISWKFLTQMPERAGAAGGILPAIVGTFYLVTGTLIIALPLGIAAAIYLSEYAAQGRFVRWVRLAIVTLAGVPSIVFGLFSLGLCGLFFKFGPSILAGNLTLACMILPTIIVASEESLQAVPRGFREGSLALGASKWQTICKNVLPYSIPGMLTGSILGVGRAAGETAPILLTAAAFYLPHLPRSVLEQCMALPYHLYILATQHPDVALVRPMQYGTALVLIALVLGLNLGAILLRVYFRRKYQW
jgi:phosphate transport system permease protein